MLTGRPKWSLVLGLGVACAAIPLALRLLDAEVWLGPQRSTHGHDRLLQALLETDQPAPPEVHPPQPRPEPATPTAPSIRSIPTTASSAPQVRVALFRQRPLRSVETRGRSQCKDAQGTAYTRININTWTGTTLRCQSKGSGVVVLNGLPYQGMIELMRSDKGWLPINQLDLERYVASVVGGEMPSHWGKEALKAQAVAARSYALVHIVRPAGKHYHLGDTTRWQVYRGRESMTSATLEATQATNGQVLSYRGGLVESLYAATAAISAEAHGHLGASMSQTGANALAQQGQAYTQILDRYYKGAELARIIPNGP
ncbi:MAG: SpoIID/LytB domain-containing protein [Synechococcus sp.]